MRNVRTESDVSLEATAPHCPLQSHPVKSVGPTDHLDFKVSSAEGTELFDRLEKRVVVASTIVNCSLYAEPTRMSLHLQWIVGQVHRSDPRYLLALVDESGNMASEYQRSAFSMGKEGTIPLIFQQEYGVVDYSDDRCATFGKPLQDEDRLDAVRDNYVVPAESQ